jgi:hypothetical protein
VGGSLGLTMAAGNAELMWTLSSFRTDQEAQ